LIQQGKDHLQMERFNEALAVYEDAIAFCTNSPGITCTDEAINGYASAKFGIYRSYLQVSERAISSGKYDLAEVYINEARKYQQENSKEIIGDAAADVVTTKLAKAYVVKADTLISRKKFEQALVYCEKAATLCAVKADVDCGDDLERVFRKAYNGIYEDQLTASAAQLKAGSIDEADQTLSQARAYQSAHRDYISYTLPMDTLERKIQSIRYAQLISEGIVQCGYQSQRDAFAKFCQARLLERTYPFKRDTRLDSLLLATARPIFEEDLTGLDKMIQSERYDAAASLLSQMIKTAKECGLDQDSFISIGLEKANHQLLVAMCNYASDSLSVLQQNAEGFVQKGQYIQAVIVYEQALELVKINPTCGFDSSAISAHIADYRIPMEYQQLMILAENYLLQKDTQSFFSTYHGAELFYAEHRVANYRLSHKSLADLCKKNSDKRFLVLAFNFFVEKKMLADALEMLRAIKSVSSGDIMNQQQTLLGERLAELDHAIEPAMDPKTKVLVYTQGDKWFNGLKRSYLKTRNKLNSTVQ
jgi:tetratricopeptide (TPR) repeat protein